MEKVKCPQCGRERKKKFARFCEACGVSFCKEIQVSEPKVDNNKQNKTNSSKEEQNSTVHKAKAEVAHDAISSKAKKFISMAAYDLAIEELESELEKDRTVPILHALSMCHLLKCGGIKDSFDFSNWFSLVMGILGAIEKAIKIDKAEKYISEAIKMEPDSNDLYKNLALCKYVAGNFEQALKMSKAIAKESKTAQEKAACHVFIGNCFMQLGNSVACSNRLQYAAFLMQDHSELSRQISEMLRAKSMLLGGAALAGYALGGAVGAALAAGAVTAFQNSSDKKQYEDNDPEILEFIQRRDAKIKRLKQEEERKEAEERKKELYGCLFTIFGVIIGLMGLLSLASVGK